VCVCVCVCGHVRTCQVRNWLLTVALGDEDWVLWLDSDIWSELAVLLLLPHAALHVESVITTAPCVSLPVPGRSN
jgi:hypothetical protein